MQKARHSITIVTRLSRSDQYCRRVLDGLLLQKNIDIHWSIVSQIELTADHLSCFEIAKENNISVTITYAEKAIPLGKLANFGVFAAQTEYILLHDDDDALRVDYLSGAITNLKNCKAVAIACHAAIVNENSSSIGKLNFILSPGKGFVKKNALEIDNLIATNSIIYSRNAFEKIGGYPEDVTVAEDWLFNLKLIDLGSIRVSRKIAAVVYVRSQLNDETSSEVNTVIGMQNDHLNMQAIIRSKAASANVASINKLNQKFSKKFIRLIDRFTFQYGGWFFPRI